MCLGSDCNDGVLDRRQFMAGATMAVAGWAVAAGQSRPPTRVLDNPSVSHGPVKFSRPGFEVGGYIARPKAARRYPAVLVVAGNLITEEYIPNTCAALAVAGFVGLAPNIFHPVPPNATAQEMNRALANRTDADYLADIHAGTDYLRQHESVASGGVGILGFCSGGRRALLYASQFDGVNAVVSFHAASMTTPAEVTRLRVPTQLHHGTADRVSPPSVSQALAEQLRHQATPVELFLYDGADHGFLAYTREPEYNPDAAQLAWDRTIAFLRRYVSA
jgi:carboxymethylenebutenolidase